MLIINTNMNIWHHKSSRQLAQDTNTTEQYDFTSQHFKLTIPPFNDTTNYVTNTVI
jgi:hypothetical protein